MRKKIVSLMLVGVCGLYIFCGCGTENKPVTDNTQKNQKSVSAEEKSEENGEVSYEYDVQEDGTLSLKRLYSNDAYSKVSVPSEIDGNAVSKVNGSLFKNDKNVKKVVLPETVKEIGEETFYFTSNMEDLTINGVVESIGQHGIYGCAKLKTLTFKEGLKTIDRDAIGQCEELTDVYLPSTLESIDSKNFYACASPIKVHVPSGSTTESLMNEIVEQSAADIEIVSE